MELVIDRDTNDRIDSYLSTELDFSRSKVVKITKIKNSLLYMLIKKINHLFYFYQKILYL